MAFLESQLALKGYDIVTVSLTLRIPYLARNYFYWTTLSIARIEIEKEGVCFWLSETKFYLHIVTVMPIQKSCGSIFSMGKTNHLRFGVFYRPPNNSVEPLVDLSATLDEFNDSAEIVLVGVVLFSVILT